MPQIINSICTIQDATTTECLYTYSSSTEATTTEQFNTGDIIFGLAIIIFFLSSFWFSFIFQPFKSI